MPINKLIKILLDGRELFADRKTGIGRVLEGLLKALNESDIEFSIILACWHFPNNLIHKDKIIKIILPRSFFLSERALSRITKSDISLFISPYPKLPLFGVHCSTINMIHDVLDLTHPAYKKRLKAFFDGYRLKKALQKADMTWYVSKWSLRETALYAGLSGRNPRVRYNGIDERFSLDKVSNKGRILEKYQLKSDYILVLGNGLPHKNLGVILEIANQLKRKIVFAGVSIKNQLYWEKRYPRSKANWINHVNDEDLPSIIRGAFCLAQPSTMEGYGYPPLEAMACGVPSVVSDIPVLRETTGGNSIFADSLKPSNWLAAINSLENKDLYEKQVRKGLSWIMPFRGNKAWEKHVEDIKELIDKGL